MSDNLWSQATLWDGEIEPPTTCFLVTFWDEGTTAPPVPAGERTVRVFAQTPTGAVALVRHYCKERGRDFRLLGRQLCWLLLALAQGLWESVSLLG
jgi:hypothetical protein